MRTVPASFPILFDVFLIMFLFFSQGFCEFWEQSVYEDRPCILSPYYLIVFWLFFVFFSGFLPVLRTICKWEPSLHPFPILFVCFLIIFIFFSGFLPVLRTICKWEPSLHPFPILFDFFLIIFCFFLRVFASFENYEGVVFLICFFCFFPDCLCVNSLVCVWFIFVVFLILSLSMWKWFVLWAESWFVFFFYFYFF